MPNNTNITAIQTWRRASADGERLAQADLAASAASEAAIHDAALAEEVTALACRQILMAGAPATLEHGPLRPMKVLSLLGA